MTFRSISALGCLALVLVANPGRAGEPTIDSKSSKPMATPCPPDTLDWVDVKSSYTFQSDFQRGDNAKGDSWSKEIELEHRIPVHLFNNWPNTDCGHWYLRLGADYTRWDFNNKGGLPLPNTLQSVSGVIALEYVVSDGAAIMLETRPGVYFEQRVRSDSFDAPTTLYAPIYYHHTDDSSFAIIAGVYYSALDKYEVLPVAGFVWNTGKWNIRAVAPAPRINYQATKDLTLWLGGQLTGGSFSTDSHNFQGKPDLNRAVVTYEEYRAGAGVTYKLGKCSLDAGAGYAFRRKFDFFRAEEGYRTDEGAPYVQVELRTGF